MDHLYKICEESLRIESTLELDISHVPFNFCGLGWWPYQHQNGPNEILLESLWCHFSKGIDLNFFGFGSNKPWACEYDTKITFWTTISISFLREYSSLMQNFCVQSISDQSLCQDLSNDISLWEPRYFTTWPPYLGSYGLVFYRKRVSMGGDYIGD